jgi:hypothetical protein
MCVPRAAGGHRSVGAAQVAFYVLVFFVAGLFIFAVVLAGAFLGIMLGSALVRFIESLLFDVKATDLGVLALPVVIISAVALSGNKIFRTEDNGLIDAKFCCLPYERRRQSARVLRVENHGLHPPTCLAHGTPLAPHPPLRPGMPNDTSPIFGHSASRL